ncbi:hypothetical protein GCM10017744_021180 [Streptomyces antimycoticus]
MEDDGEARETEREADGKPTGATDGEPPGKLPFPDAALVAYGKAHPRPPD